MVQNVKGKDSCGYRRKFPLTFVCSVTIFTKIEDRFSTCEPHVAAMMISDLDTNGQLTTFTERRKFSSSR